MSVHHLLQANIESLKQAEHLLIKITDSQYRAVIHPFTANIGKHLRHITDHYRLLLEGLPGTLVEYDHRERLATEENERSAMILRLRSLCNELSRLTDTCSKDVPLSISLAVNELEESPTVKSTLSRELVFLQSHSVHHYAIISAILKLQGIQFDPDFGIAPSTLKYEHGKKCAP